MRFRALARTSFMEVVTNFYATVVFDARNFFDGPNSSFQTQSIRRVCGRSDPEDNTFIFGDFE